MDRIYKYATYALWTIGIITIIFIVYQYFFVKNEVALLGAFGILISAFLASVTMARTYAQNERINQEKKERKEFEVKKFALLAALDIFYSYYKNDNSLEVLREVKHEYADRIERSSELLQDFYDELYLAIELLYESPEEPIITKVSLANNKLIEQANILKIKHPFKEFKTNLP